MQRLEVLKVVMLATREPADIADRSRCRSMATSGRGSGVVATTSRSQSKPTNHLIITHEVTTTGPTGLSSHHGQASKGDTGSGGPRCRRRSRLLQQRGDPRLRERGHHGTLPKPMTSNSKAEGRFGKQDFRYVADADNYICPAGEKAQPPCHNRGKRIGPAPLLDQCLPEMRHQECLHHRKGAPITRWEHEHVS